VFGQSGAPLGALIRLKKIPGRIAQRESVPFTRERSKVRSLVRPPFVLLNQEKIRLGLAFVTVKKISKTTPCKGRPRRKRLIVPLYQLEGDALGTLEEPQLPADVVHLVAQHGYAAGDEVRGGRLNVVDAGRKVIEA
jgi:hypothetical protein